MASEPLWRAATSVDRYSSAHLGHLVTGDGLIVRPLCGPLAYPRDKIDVFLSRSILLHYCAQLAGMKYCVTFRVFSQNYRRSTECTN